MSRWRATIGDNVVLLMRKFTNLWRCKHRKVAERNSALAPTPPTLRHALKASCTHFTKLQECLRFVVYTIAFYTCKSRVFKLSFFPVTQLLPRLRPRIPHILAQCRSGSNGPGRVAYYQARGFMKSWKTAKGAQSEDKPVERYGSAGHPPHPSLQQTAQMLLADSTKPPTQTPFAMPPTSIAHTRHSTGESTSWASATWEASSPTHCGESSTHPP
jgi:hypothetical protein